MGALKSSKCSKGHVLKAPNLYYRTNGQRECKKCKELRNAEIKEKRRKGLLKPAPKRVTKKSIIARGGEGI